MYVTLETIIKWVKALESTWHREDSQPMSSDMIGVVQGVLILSQCKTEVFQGHQPLTPSQDLWVLLGSRGAGPPCTHLYPKPFLRHHVTGETSSLSTSALDTQYLKSIYELLSWSRPVGVFCPETVLYNPLQNSDSAHQRNKKRGHFTLTEEKHKLKNYPSMCWKEFLITDFYFRLHIVIPLSMK